MTLPARPSYFPDLARDSDTLILVPPTATQSTGFAPQTPGIAQWMNWIGKGMSKWSRHLDNAILWDDLFEDNAINSVKQGVPAFPLGSGLSPTFILGGVVIVKNVRLDCSYPQIAQKYPPGSLVWPSNSVRYLMGRVEEGSSSTLAELKVGSNPAEAGWYAITKITTDATDIIAQEPYLLGTAGYVYPKFKWVFEDVVSLTDGFDVVGDSSITGNLTLSGTGNLIAAGSGTFAKGITVNNTGDLPRVVATLDNSSGSGFKVDLGSGVAAKGLEVNLVDAPGFGILGIGDGTSTGLLLGFIHAGPAAKVASILGNNAATATVLELVGGNTQALLASGLGGGAGATLRSGTTAGAVGANVYSQSNSGVSLNVTTHAAALSTARGIKSVATGAAISAELSAVNNYVLTLAPKLVAPQFGAMLFQSQQARPTDVSSGQFTHLSEGTGHFAVSCFADFGQPGPGAGWRGVWTTTGGLALARGFVSGIAYFSLTGSYQVVVTMKAEAGNAPKIGGRKGIFRLSFSPRVTDTAAVQRINIRVRDVGAGDPTDVSTPGTDIYLRQGAGSGGTAGVYLPPLSFSGFREPITLMFSANIPAAGDRSWSLHLSCTDTMDIRDPCLELVGVE